MSILTPSDTPCGIFGPSVCTNATLRAVTVYRAAHLAQATAPVQNASGEVVLSFVAVGTFQVDWHPKSAGLLRQLQGQVVEIAAVAFGAPTVDIQELDRCTVDAKRLECVNVLPWGDHNEYEFRALAR
jgi:hypothetical protein